MNIKSNLSIGIFCLYLWYVPCLAECPVSDVTGDCFVDMSDLAVFAGQWLAGDKLTDDMIVLPSGYFEMGDSMGDGYPKELPVHSVLVDSFAIGKYEVTNGQYCSFLNSALKQGIIEIIDGGVYQAGSGTGYPYCTTSVVPWEYPENFENSQIGYSNGGFSVHTKNNGDMSDYPVVMVTWYGAAAFCNWKSIQEGRQSCYDLSTWACDFTKKGYHLPTEAQWEYAARSNLPAKRFPWGDTISHNQANYYCDWEEGKPYYSYDACPYEGYHPTWDDGIYPFTSPVGALASNGFGLYGMAGNVYEWCNDWWMDYNSDPQINPIGPATGQYRAIRSGCWYSTCGDCRVAFRYGILPMGQDNRIGFRISLKI